MATQTDVQQYIQQLTPGSVNNGNPNTAYNNPPGPVMDANGNWFGGGVAPAASIQLGGATSPLAGLHYSTPNFPRFSPLPLTSTPFTPTTIPNGGWGGGGETGGTGGTGGTTPTGGTTTPQTPTGGALGSPLGGTNQQLFNAINGALAQQPRGTGTGGGTGMLGGGTSGGTGSNINWQQVLDAAGDAIGLPGNWYLNGTGKWDASNIISSTLSTITGLPISSLMNMIGKYGMEHGWSINNMFVDHYMDNSGNAFANQYGSLGPYIPSITPAIPGVDTSFASQAGVPNINLGYASVPNYTNGSWIPDPVVQSTYNAATGGTPVGSLSGMGYTGNQINQIMNGLGYGGNYMSPQSIAAGGDPYSTVLEGDAARAFMEGMRNQAVMQTGADAFGHVYAQ